MTGRKARRDCENGKYEASKSERRRSGRDRARSADGMRRKVGVTEGGVPVLVTMRFSPPSWGLCMMTVSAMGGNAVAVLFSRGVGFRSRAKVKLALALTHVYARTSHRKPKIHPKLRRDLLNVRWVACPGS